MQSFEFFDGNPLTYTATVCTRANEVFTTCGNDGCQGTCSSPTPAGCVPTCINGGGCVCQTGFVRNAAGNCIPPSTCRKYCLIILDYGYVTYIFIFILLPLPINLFILTLILYNAVFFHLK